MFLILFLVSHTLSHQWEFVIISMYSIVDGKQAKNRNKNIHFREYLCCRCFTVCTPSFLHFVIVNVCWPIVFFIIGHWSSFMFVIIHPVFCYKPLKENVLFLKSFMLFYRMQLPDECVFFLNVVSWSSDFIVYIFCNTFNMYKLVKVKLK